MRSTSYTDRALDSQLAQSLIGRDAPHDLIVNRDFVTRIGNLCDVSFVRKMNISFNRIRSLDGIDQLPQLKQLLAYACDIDNIECIRSIPKIETIFLQQNKISILGDTFNGLSKLLELRLDQNRIVKIEYLNSCVSLRKLDLSFNNIENLSGLNGLQQLQELKISNNNIKTLSLLKSLPSIKDLDVSNNQLKNLDGIQNIPTLEYIRADHNMITEVKLLPMLGSNKAKLTNDNNDSSSSKYSKLSTDKKLTTSTTTTSGKKTNNMTEVAARSGPMLTELSLCGNRIRGIHNLEIYKDTLEVVDLSSNNLCPIETNNISQTLQNCIKLTELRIYNNPICDDSSAMDKLILELSNACPVLKAVDGLAIVANTDSKHPGQTASLSEAYKIATTTNISEKKDSIEFHTWNSGNDSIVDDNINDTTTINSTKEDEDDITSSSDSDHEYHHKKKKQKQKDMKNLDKDIEDKETNKPYQLQLKDMLSIEEIQEKELIIRNKLKYCKNKLENATLSIFGFTDDTSEVEDKYSKKIENTIENNIKMSESGKRVATVLNEVEENLSRQASSSTMMSKKEIAVEEEVVSVMKESLVNRVRLAVSSSSNSRSNSASANMKELNAPSIADIKPTQQHSARSLPSQENSTPTPTTTCTPAIGSIMPNNPLLTDDLRASFELHRNQNNANTTSNNTNNNSSSRNVTRAEDKHESKTVSPTLVMLDTDQQQLSPNSHSVASKPSKPFLSSANKAAFSKGTAAMLGSGLTRHGTKIKQRTAGAEAKGGDEAHSPIQHASVSLLRAAGADVESLDIMNLKITKQTGHTYMTESVEDGEDQGSETEDQKVAESADGGGADDDYEVPLESIEEDVGEGEDAVLVSPSRELLLFEEVTTRADDRFGRALGGFRAAGYDPRRVHRATAEEIKSEEEVGRLRTPLVAGTTDSLDLRSSENVRLAEELARSLRRGHSAPNMDISELSRISTHQEHSSAVPVPASPTLSMSSSSKTVSVARLSSYQPTAASSNTATADVTTSAASGTAAALSPRPIPATVSLASQPKLKFHLPQQTQAQHSNKLEHTDTATNTTTTTDSSSTTTTPRVDFNDLEKEILKASTKTIKSTQNPTMPLPYAPSGPYTVRSKDYK